MRSGMSYEDADVIAREFERLIGDLYENKFIQKSNWMTMMEELSTPQHMKQDSRRFPIHKEEQSIANGLARVEELIKRLVNTGDEESTEPEERSSHDLENGEAFNGGIGF